MIYNIINMDEIYFRTGDEYRRSQGFYNQIHFSLGHTSNSLTPESANILNAGIVAHKMLRSFNIVQHFPRFARHLVFLFLSLRDL